MPTWTTRKGDRLIVRTNGVIVHTSAPEKGSTVEIVRAKGKEK